MRSKDELYTGDIVEYDGDYYMVRDIGVTFFSREPYVDLIRYWNGDGSNCTKFRIRGNPNLKKILSGSVQVQEAR